MLSVEGEPPGWGQSKQNLAESPHHKTTQHSRPPTDPGTRIISPEGLNTSMRPILATVLALSAAVATHSLHAQERLPQQVAGTWRITRILPVQTNACWTGKQAEPLVGTLLQYSPTSMRWHGGTVPLTGITTRSVTSEDIAQETPGGETPSLKLTDLGIHARGVTEVNLQHEDADITGSTTEVPGDSILLAGPGRIILSACGVYMEARRVPAPAPEGTRKGL